MIKIRYSIVCDYCGQVFCDCLMSRHDFESHELQSKCQETKDRGWAISPGGDHLVHVLCDKCEAKGITCLDINDKETRLQFTPI